MATTGNLKSLTKDLSAALRGDWLQAEESLTASRQAPQPKGSVTTQQFAAMMNLQESQARNRLLILFHGKLATRQQWKDGRTVKWVYFLKK